MPLRLQITTNLQSLLQRLQRQQQSLPQRREQLLASVAQSILAETIQQNPVDTGRSRAAWVAPLEQLGGTPPQGWPGPHPNEKALQEGQQAGSLERQQTESTTDLQVTNAIDYIAYLEYGTEKTAPQSMLRKAINKALQTLGNQLTRLFQMDPR